MTDSEATASKKNGRNAHIPVSQEVRLWGIPLTALLFGLGFMWNQNERIIIVETNQALLVSTMDEVKDALRDNAAEMRAHKEGGPHLGAATQQDILKLHKEVVAVREEVRSAVIGMQP